MLLPNLIRNNKVETILQTKEFFDFLDTCVQEHSLGFSHCLSADAKVYLNTAQIDIWMTPPAVVAMAFIPHKCIVKVKMLEDGSIHFFGEKGDMKILESKTFTPKE